MYRKLMGDASRGGLMIHRISTHTLEAFQKADVDTLSPLLGQIYSYFSWKIAIMFAHAAVLVPATCVRKIDVPDSDKSILFAHIVDWYCGKGNVLH